MRNAGQQPFDKCGLFPAKRLNSQAFRRRFWVEKSFNGLLDSQRSFNHILVEIIYRHARIQNYALSVNSA